MVADIAGLDSMRQAFLDGVDIHAQTASEVFGVPLAAMDSETRRKAKAINFGIIYGISGFGLARQLGVPQSEASDYIDTNFKKFFCYFLSNASSIIRCILTINNYKINLISFN